MKRTYIIFLLFFSMQILQAQGEVTSSAETLFETKDIDVQPEFPGGIDNCYTFFYKKFKKPEVPNLIGKIFVSFIVEIDGTLTNIRTLKDPGFGTGAEAEKVMQQSPKWIPGRKEGKKVRVNYILPIGIHTD